MNKQIFRLFLSTLIVLFLSAQAMGRYEFNEPKLRDVWIWDDPGKVGKYSLEEKPGCLSITCEPCKVGENHDVWATRGTAPMMLIEAPEGDYSVETHVKMRKFPMRGYAGIQIIGSEGLGDADFTGPWGHLVIEFYTNREDFKRVRWSFGKEGNPVDAFESQVARDGDEAYLKLVKKGVEWDCYFKEKIGANWKIIGTGELSIGEKYYIGFVVGKARWTGWGEVVADFDYFRSPVFPVEPKLLYVTTLAKIKAGQ